MAPSPLRKDFFTTVQAAEYLGIKPWSARMAVSRGTLNPSEHRIGNSRLFTIKELDRYKKHHSRNKD